MNRRLSSRVLAGFLALWLPLLLAEPVPMHSCPMHQAEQTRTATPDHYTGHSQHAKTDHSHHSAHQHHAVTESASATQAPDHTQHQTHPDCSCIGQCSSAAVGVVPTINTFELAVATAEFTSQPPTFESAAFAAPAYILPYANGPPTPA